MLDQTITGPAHGFLGGPRVPARVEAPAHDRFTLEPLSPSIGAVVGGVSLADPVDDELFALLNAALLEWKVLFFRHQELTHAGHLRFAGRWGDLESHPFFSVINDHQTEADIVRFEKDDKASGYENMWHSDVSWRAEPSLGSVLRAIEVPPVGGDTLWSDMAAAYDYLTDELKQRLEGVTAVHDWIRSFGSTMDPAVRDRLRPDFPPVEHPVVRTHPETGRKLLYVNRIFTDHLVGFDPDESAELLEFLCLQATIPEYQCRWHWEAGDVAFWDNRASQHYAVSDYAPNRRVMERITIIGDKPY
ncbi:MAG: TauD/TfdA family dioxygenase [Actinomycetota bacterium]|nr:TauD/TfdA family dioxygenase [Actinomycetota bacterium]